MAEVEETEIKEDVEFKEETELTKHIHYVNKRRASNTNSADFDLDGSLLQLINTNSRELRIGLVSLILLAWAGLMIPYDIAGADIHADFVNDRTVFETSLYMWLIGHCAVVICSLSCILTLKFYKSNPYLINTQLILIFTGSFLQVIIQQYTNTHTYAQIYICHVRLWVLYSLHTHFVRMRGRLQMTYYGVHVSVNAMVYICSTTHHLSLIWDL